MSDDSVEAVVLHLRLHRDHIYMDGSDYRTCFADIRSVALLRDGDDLLILPVANEEAGGFYIKQVNARGDRAIHAADFFRLNLIDETISIEVDAQPQSAMAGYIVRDLFSEAQTKFAIRK